MYKIDIPSASDTRPEYNPTTTGYFKEGTQLKDWLLNIIQEEMANVVLDAEMTLDKQDNSQLVKAISSYISNIMDKYSLFGYFSTWITTDVAYNNLTTPSQFLENDSARYLGLQYMSSYLSGNGFIHNVYSTYYKMYVDVVESTSTHIHLEPIDDAGYLYIDDVLVLSSTGAAIEVDVDLDVGIHKIEFIHNNSGGGANYFGLFMDLFYTKKVKYVSLDVAEADRWL